MTPDAAGDEAESTAAPESGPPTESDDILALRDVLGDGVLDSGHPLEQPTVVVGPDALPAAAAALKARGYNQLTSVTAVDFLPAEPRFQVVYHFTLVPEHVVRGDASRREDALPRRLRVRVPVAEDAPVVASLTGLFPTANWLEREVWDMFGIEFAGHPDLRRILMPDDTEGHPLRKDYPLRYEEVAFTYNRNDVTGAKEFAQE
jgi:NADH-quinone oxidoreductase subunit C